MKKLFNYWESNTDQQRAIKFYNCLKVWLHLQNPFLVIKSKFLLKFQDKAYHCIIMMENAFQEENTSPF